MYLKFDNSEDGFFPDNETVTLLNEIEDEYQASVDFIRVIDEVGEGDLQLESTWQQLATIEAEMLDDEQFLPYQYPLFGTQANSGMASGVIQWQTLQDTEHAQGWLANLTTSIELVRSSNSSDLDASLVEFNSTIKRYSSVPTSNCR